MQKIKRKILLESSTDRAYNSKTYGTITATTFYLNVLLTQSIDDMGLFTDMSYIPKSSTKPDYGPLISVLKANGLSFPFMSGVTPSKVANDYNYQLRLTGKTAANFYAFANARITGYTDSKIEDVRSYKANQPYQVGFNVASETYSNFSGATVVGVDRVTKTGSVATYVFGASKTDLFIGTSAQSKGLLYEDFSGSTRFVGEDPIGLTKVTYNGEGWNDTNTSISALSKQEYLFGIISPPEVKSELFIDRGVTSILDRHLRLSEISNLGELARYGNGFFKLNKQ